MGGSSSSRSSENGVPNIAFLGFGGGQRAMVDLMGSLVQLHNNEVPNIALLGSIGGQRAMVDNMVGSSSRHRNTEVRIQHSLNEKEEAFVARRKKTVLQCLRKLQINCDWDNIPNIALLGSGGGQRAMVGLLGSLVELDKAGLLDCILYLSGVSGSTWCMASLYKEPDWSTKLEIVKNKIIERLNGPGVSRGDTYEKLTKYWESTGRDGKDFSLTHIWAAMVITTYVKEIDEHTLSEQWDHLSKDPFPIYTVIDKQCKQQGDGDPWFEISPYEAGYSLTGAFVETSSFGSQFDNGRKIKEQPEMDMMYLQALCGSALANDLTTRKFFWETIMKGAAAFKDSFLPEVDSHFMIT